MPAPLELNYQHLIECKKSDSEEEVDVWEMKENKALMTRILGRYDH